MGILNNYAYTVSTPHFELQGKNMKDLSNSALFRARSISNPHVFCALQSRLVCVAFSPIFVVLCVPENPPDGPIVVKICAHSEGCASVTE